MKPLFQFVLASVVTLCMIACSSTPEEPVLNTKAVLINEKDLAKYWIAERERQRLHTTKAQNHILKQTDVFVIVSYLIDSNGNVYNVDIIDSNQKGHFDDLVHRSLKRKHFSPAKSNSNRTPVFVTAMMNFSRVRNL